MRQARADERRLLERALARYRGPRLPGGHVRRPSAFDPDQLAIGVGVELEHTSRPELALEIAMAHLAERSDYYARLERMETGSRMGRVSRPAVFVFAQHGCPACENYVPRLQRLAAGAPFPVGVYDLASDDRAADFANKIVPGGVKAVPTTVVMTSSGKLKTHTGALGNAEIQRVLKSALG